MTEQEFDQQLWRRYDSVTLDNGLTAAVSNVCFTTRSVRIYVKDLPAEWFKCDRIESHKSRKGDPSDDASIIEELHKKVLAQDEHIKGLAGKNKKLWEKLQTNHTQAIKENIEMIRFQLTEKKKRAENIDNCLRRLGTVLDNLEKEES